tara:strand:+ start:248 stop:511 length:264 start_codon:yes stop_codon:yes gene_type:complete
VQSQIKQLDKNKFEIVQHGIPKRLTFLGRDEWMLSIGVNSIENIRSGKFKTLQYKSLERLECEYPEWKGISTIFSSGCPHVSATALH